MRFVRFCACAALISAACGGRRDAPTISLTVSPATGSVDAAGLYTAPQSPGVYHVIATSHADPSRSAIASINVVAQPPTAVIIAPPIAALEPGKSVRFTAVLAGTRNAAVTWSADGGS